MSTWVNLFGMTIVSYRSIIYNRYDVITCLGTVFGIQKKDNTFKDLISSDNAVYNNEDNEVQMTHLCNNNLACVI